MKAIRSVTLALAAALSLPAGLSFTASAGAVEMFSRVPVPKSAKPAPEHLVGTAAVEFNPTALAAMRPGETAWIGMPNGRRYEIVLDRLEQHAEGEFTWTGHVADGTVDNMVLVTLGRDGTYATFTLPDGNWGAIPGEANDWLFDADFSELHVDRSGESDAKIPPDLVDAARPKADPSCPAISAMPSQQHTIDLLVALAPDFVSAHGGAANANTRINNLIAQANTYYANSKIAITLRRVATINVNFPGPSSVDNSNALDTITNGQGEFANFPLLRSLYGADMVLFMRGPVGNSIGGVAWIGGYATNPISGSAGSMFSVNGDAPGFGATLLAHELGHNMGSHHDPANAGTTTPGATSYAYGWTRCGSGPSATCPSSGGFQTTGSGGFGTIMSYWRPTLARFSNPNDTCSGNGSPTAACSSTISSGSPAFSVQPDEVRTFNCTRAGIAAMRTAYVPDCANITLDSDNDGLPNCVEQALGRNANAKDNDIFATSRDGSLRFAMQQYRDFLSREADADGLNHWTSSLVTGAQSRGQMVEGYFNSAEFQGAIAPVARLYFAYFLRVPDYAGLQHWIGQFKSGVPLASISQAFASSGEFANRYGSLSNAQFVSLVYNNVLARAPDAAGLAHWVGQLTAGMSRGNMMVAFSESAEYRNLIGSEIYVTMMYVGMLRRSPDAGGFAHWTGYLDSGNSGQALINGFLTSAEYRARFL